MLLRKVNSYDTIKQNEFWEKSNNNIFSTKHIPRSFTNRIRFDVNRLKDTNLSQLYIYIYYIYIIYIYAFLDMTKVGDFPRKNADVTRIQGDESRDLYIFWIFFRQGVTVPSFFVGNHRHCDTAYIMVLVCHVIFQDIYI